MSVSLLLALFVIFLVPSLGLFSSYFLMRDSHNRTIRLIRQLVFNIAAQQFLLAAMAAIVMLGGTFPVWIWIIWGLLPTIPAIRLSMHMQGLTD